MEIIAENTGGSYKIVEAGSYPARCYRMIEIGTVTETFNNETKRLKKVSITWELPTELAVFREENGEEPFSISKFYTLSMHEKATLRKDLEGWRGKAFTEEEAKRFNITALLGKECLISVIHKASKDGSRIYAEISSISRMPKTMTCPPAINECKVLCYQDFDHNFFETLPDFLKDKIKSTPEYQSLISAQTGLTQALPDTTGHEEESDDLPF